MSNEFKEIDTKNRTHYFLDNMINIKILIQIKSRQMESHKKIFLFTTLDTQQSKT